jgi:hypothetical protein
MKWKELRTRPVSRRRHSSIVEASPKPSTSAGEKTHDPIPPLERLSLRLDYDNENPARSFLDEAGPEEEFAEPVEDKIVPTQESAHTLTTEDPPLAREVAVPSRSLEVPSATFRPQRFSLLKFRHASDSALSSTYRSSEAPPLPAMPPPKIITTSPTTHLSDQTHPKKTRTSIFKRSLTSSPSRPLSAAPNMLSTGENGRRSTQSLNAQDRSSTSNPQHVSFDNSSRPSMTRLGAPPAYGDESTSSLAIPISRLSESSRSDASAGDHSVYAQTTTTHTISTTTTFFRLPRRKKKDKGPLFPLPVRIPPPVSGRSSLSRTPTETGGPRKSISPSRRPFSSVRFHNGDNPSPQTSPTQSSLALTNAPFGAPGPAIIRTGSVAGSQRSGVSTPSISLAPPRIGARGRSSTMGSLARSVEEGSMPPPSGRTSTSTAGRKSFGDIFSLPHRLRQNSEPAARHGSANSPGTPGSYANSMQIQREEEPQLVYPNREDSDTPASYLEKLEAAVQRGSMATILCKSPDEFSKTCLRKYMRGFSYFGDPIDVAVRKMLMEVELPKETQQIDRLLAGFSDRYFECNPGIFVSADETSIVAFSILLLHSDTHNKSNKRKMQRSEYIKNTQGPAQVSHEVLECFYDNVCYTPFIHFEDEVALNSHRLTAPKPKKSLIRTKSSENIRGPVDPYNLILDNKIEMLRPTWKDVMDTEDAYNAMGTASAFDANDLHTAFARAGVLQIVSARSRPDAFLTQATITNPAEAQMGLVSIKVAKVGLLWRKDPKKKKAKRPWQEWGAILTDSKLYFFKDVGWVRKLMLQYDEYAKSLSKKGTLVFKPPLASFDPDAFMSMDDAIALLDSNYKKHKNAFVFIKHGGFEEIFLANDQVEMNDWIAKLNYAAAFRTAGVRMRGMMGASYDGPQPPITRKDSEISTTSNENATAKSERPTQNSQSRSNDHQMVWEIMFYRRQIISEKISDAEEKLAATQRELDNLLRNARHLQILLPFQSKTREALILAAGRMSAKLKWTRVEMWRTKCHRDLLKMDLDQEGALAFPVPFGRHGSTTTTPQKATPLKIVGPTRTNTENNYATLSPTSTLSHARHSSQNLARLRTPEKAQMSPEGTPVGPQRRKSAAEVDVAWFSTGSSALVEEKFAVQDEHNPESHALQHQSSIVSSARSKPESERYMTPTPGLEDEDTQIGLDAATSNGKRPDTSESDRDRVGTMSPEATPRERGGSVRRSLQRTLRDSHQGVHQTPSHHRGKKSRESGSSFAISEDGRPMSPENQELKRGTGSFIVHGKKASVVTFGSEWQKMTTEDRTKLRSVAQAEHSKGEVAIDDGTASNLSGPSAVAEAALSSGDEGSGPARTHSTATATGEGNAGFLTPPESGAPRKMSSSTMSERSSLRAPSPLRSSPSLVAQG